MRFKRYRVVDHAKWDRAKSTLFIVSIVATYMVALLDTRDGGAVSVWVLIPIVGTGLLGWNLFIKEGKQK